MEFIHGVTLDDEALEAMGSEARIKIYEKIGEQLQLLRSIPPPNPRYYGRINYQAFHPSSFIVSHGRHLIGPCDTYKAFLKEAYKGMEFYLLGTYIFRSDISPLQHLLASSFFDSFGESSSGSAEPKLSHMDLHSGNIMLVPQSGSNASEKIEDHELWIIDWEYMAWMPAWAEAASSMKRLPIIEGEERWEPQWRISNGIKPFYFAEAAFWLKCCGEFHSFI